MLAPLRCDFSEIPVIDLEPWSRGDRERAALAERVCDVCHDVGFFVLVHRRVDPRLVESVFSVSRRFFDPPLDKKQLIDKQHSRHFRGWEAVGSEYTNNRPDIRE